MRNEKVGLKGTPDFGGSPHPLSGYGPAGAFLTAWLLSNQQVPPARPPVRHLTEQSLEEA
jgi:hypothetical protein